MPRVIVHVMPKPELLDPRGKAVAAALHRLALTQVADVRVGKRFELTITDELTAELRGEIERIAQEVLSNDVIEDVVLIEVVD